MRNPFAVDDVPDPTAPDVEDFTRSVRVAADPSTDENALAWVAVATEADGLEGAWTSRWRSGDGPWQQGVATLRIDGDRAYILYNSFPADAAATAPALQGTYLVEAQVRGDRLVGRYVNLNDPRDTSPWLGVVVDAYRIDGYWARGRWDLRRCSPDERPEPILAALVTEARQLGATELRELLGFARYLRWKSSGS